MIYTVTFNPSLDYVITVKNFQSGKLNRTESEQIFPGGKGINVSMILSELGLENTALGFIAGFTGTELQARLQEQGIHTDFISAENGSTRINMKIRSESMTAENTAYIENDQTSEDMQAAESAVEEAPQRQIEETEMNGQGPIISEEELAQLMEKISAMTKDDILVVSGSVSRGIPQNIYGEIAKLCHDKNINVIVDASSALLWNALEYAPFLIKPNHHELGDIFNREIQSQDEIIFYAKELQNRGARNVLVSAGSRGAILLAEDGNVYEMSAPQGEVLNSVGAGDSMVAGFIAEYFKSYDYEKALKLGICAGSATAFSEGLAIMEDIEKLIRKEK